jgi:hypothetical protein
MFIFAYKITLEYNMFKLLFGCKKKKNSTSCRICLCQKKLKCLHLCEECNYVIKKYYDYKDCPYCLEIIDIIKT